MTNRLAQRQTFLVQTYDELTGNRAEREHLLAAYQYSTMWTYAANVIIGLWLITSPFLYNYRSHQLFVSDIVCGAATIILELVSFSTRRYMTRWLVPLIGVWLLFAPLVFWAPNPATYILDTLAGCLLITFSIVIPGTPGKARVEDARPDIPPGWTYNPSSWIRRWLGIALALVGFFISRYLAARQLGYMPHAWDPFFGGSSDRVLHSVVSRSFPISDAGFGSVAYMLEVLAGFMGDRARWRSSPWIVTTFALLVVPLGVTSIVLVVLQPMVVHAWCGLCLIAAVALLSSVPLAVHEIIAMGLFLLDAQSRGKNIWRLFWFGGAIDGAGAKDPDRTRYSLAQCWIASVQGVTIPWTLALQGLIGIWLMVRPDVLPFGVASANCDHMLGALAITIAAVATAEVTRSVRFLNIAIGILLIASSLLFAIGEPVVFTSELVCGLVLMATSLPKGRLLERYDGWDRFIK